MCRMRVTQEGSMPHPGSGWRSVIFFCDQSLMAITTRVGQLAQPESDAALQGLSRYSETPESRCRHGHRVMFRGDTPVDRS